MKEKVDTCNVTDELNLPYKEEHWSVPPTDLSFNWEPSKSSHAEMYKLNKDQQIFFFFPLGTGAFPDNFGGVIVSQHTLWLSMIQVFHQGRWEDFSFFPKDLLMIKILSFSISTWL